MVIAISAVLVTLAAPSVRNLIESNGISDNVNSVMSAMTFARAEALKRGMPVTMCRSVNADTADSPSCSDGAEWESGWVVFTDVDNNGKFDAGKGDVLLLAQGSLARSGVIRHNVTGGLRFAATGLMSSAASGFTFARSDTAPVQRTLCIAKLGRARLIADPEQKC